MNVDYVETETKDKDGNVTKEMQPRDDESLKKLEGLVKQAVGFVDGRDGFEISNIRFDRSEASLPDSSFQSQGQREMIVKIVKNSSLAVAAVCVLLFFRGLLKKPVVLQEALPALASASGSAAQAGGDTVGGESNASLLAQATGVGETGDAEATGGQAVAEFNQSELAALQSPQPSIQQELRNLLISHVKTDPEATAKQQPRWFQQEG